MENEGAFTESMISEKIKSFEIAGQWIAGIKIFQRCRPFQNLHICRKGIAYFGLSKSFFIHQTEMEFKKLIFDEKADNICLIDSSEPLANKTVKQKVYIKNLEKKEFEYLEMIVVEEYSENGIDSPVYKSYQFFKLGLQNWIKPKFTKLAKELTFQKMGMKNFSLLTERNKEVLSWWAKGLKADEIAGKLFISVNSVNSHKKRIKEVLNTSEIGEIRYYAKAYDLF
jgi:DNA-binding CsgD family transcriptional regulator